MYDFYDYSLPTSSMSTSFVWTIISIVVAIVGGIALYFTIFSDNNKKQYKGFMAKLYDFVKFKKMLISSILKIGYIVTAIFITLSSFSLISYSFLGFLGYLIFGNLIARIAFEFSLVILGIYENTTEINKKMK